MSSNVLQSERVKEWSDSFLIGTTQRPSVEGLLVGDERPVPMLGHCRSGSAVLTYTQDKLTVAAVTV